VKVFSTRIDIFFVHSNRAAPDTIRTLEKLFHVVFGFQKQHFITMYFLRGPLFTIYGNVAKFGLKRKNVDIN